LLLPSLERIQIVNSLLTRRS